MVSRYKLGQIGNLPCFSLKMSQFPGRFPQTYNQEAPWLLLFARGELILSENPDAPRSGGLGFAARLRYGAPDASWVVDGGGIPSLKLTFSPLKIGLPNRKGLYSNHPFVGAMLVLGSVTVEIENTT